MVIRTVKQYSLFYIKIPDTLSASRVTLDVTSLGFIFFIYYNGITCFYFPHIFESFRVLQRPSFIIQLHFYATVTENHVQSVSLKQVHFLSNLIDFALTGWSLSINPCSCLVGSLISTDSMKMEYYVCKQDKLLNEKEKTELNIDLDVT